MTASHDLPDRPVEGQDGTREVYRERIHPPWWAWLLVAAIVRVDDRVLRVGRARLPLCYIGDVRALDADTTTAAMRTRADANAYLLVRPGYADTSVAVAVTDARDPHPYWLISARHPDELAAAITQAAHPLVDE